MRCVLVLRRDNEAHLSPNRPTDDLTKRSIIIPLTSGPSFHRLKMNPASGFRLLGLWQHNGYFHLWASTYDLREGVGEGEGSTRFRDPMRHTANEKKKGIAFHLAYVQDRANVKQREMRQARRTN